MPITWVRRLICSPNFSCRLFHQIFLWCSIGKFVNASFFARASCSSGRLLVVRDYKGVGGMYLRALRDTLDLRVWHTGCVESVRESRLRRWRKPTGQTMLAASYFRSSRVPWQTKGLVARVRCRLEKLHHEIPRYGRLTRKTGVWVEFAVADSPNSSWITCGPVTRDFLAINHSA